MELIIIGLALVVGVAWWMYNNHDKVEDVVEQVEDAVDEIEERSKKSRKRLKKSSTRFLLRMNSRS